MNIDLQTALQNLDALPFDDRCDIGYSFSDFGNYLTENPGALVEFARQFEKQYGELDDAQTLALFQWAHMLRMEGVALARSRKDGRMVIAREAGQNRLVNILDEEDVADVCLIVDAEQHASEQVLAAEKAWMHTGMLAPVVGIFFRGQTEDSKGNIIESREEDRWQWDGTQHMLTIELQNRHASCEEDSTASDQLRDDSQAPQDVREWPGPFAVFVCLYPPSEHLLSLRQAVCLMRDTATAANAQPIRGPRL